MPTYLLALAKTKDAELEKQLMAGMMPMIGRHGMEPVVTPMSPIEEVQGQWPYDGIFVISFPDREKAEAFINDPDFKALEELREKAGDAVMVMFDDVRG